MENENENKLKELLNSVPDVNTSLSVTKIMNDIGMNELKITHPKVKKDYRCQQVNSLYDVDSFAEYVNQEFKDKDFVYVTDDCVAYIGIEPTNKDSKFSEMIAKKHPSFERLVENQNCDISAKDFQKILYPFRSQLTGFRVLLTQIKVSKSAEIFEGKKQGVICTTKFQGEEKNELVEVPEELKIKLNPYLGYGDAEIELSIEPHESGGRVYFKYEIYNLEEMKLEICKQIKIKLREVVKKGVHIVEGTHYQIFKEIV